LYLRIYVNFLFPRPKYIFSLERSKSRVIEIRNYTNITFMKVIAIFKIIAISFYAV